MLFSHQEDVLKTAIERSGPVNGLCLSLPMGFGKSRSALALGLRTTTGIFLIVCSKSLVMPWIKEVKAFKQGAEIIKFEVLHKEFAKRGKPHADGGIQSFEQWTPRENTRVVIVTHDIVVKSYRSAPHIASQFVVRDTESRITTYSKVNEPLHHATEGMALLHSLTFEAVFIDECQNYTNCEVSKTRALASLHAKKRWLLSGTVFQEAKMERILGFFLLLNEGPRSIPECAAFIKSASFKGLDSYCIIKTENPRFLDVELKTEIVSHDLSENEATCYTILEDIVRSILTVLRAKTLTPEAARTLRGTLLAMLTYIRQCLVSPMIAIASILKSMIHSTFSIDTEDTDTDNATVIQQQLLKKLQQHKLTEWADSPDANRSSRFLKTLELLEKHKDTRVVVFCSSSICLKVLMKLLHTTTPAFTIDSDSTMDTRDKVFNDFAKSINGVLFVTYAIGAEGLNLQCANVAIMLDFYWNRGKQDQAISRIYRYGQLNKTVHHYILVSNTNLENLLLKKQFDKLKIIKRIATGRVRTFKTTILSYSEIYKMVNSTDNVAVCRITNLDPIPLDEEPPLEAARPTPITTNFAQASGSLMPPAPPPAIYTEILTIDD